MEGIRFAFDWELKLMIWLQDHMGSSGAAAASFITMFGEELVLIAVLGFIYWCYDKKAGQRIGMNIMIGLILNPMIKNVMLRRRPYMDHKAIDCLDPVDDDADIYDITAQGFSFPSGHAMNAAILYGSLPGALSEHPAGSRGTGRRLLRILAIVLPALIGCSRVLLGVHYPTDVLAGWLCGGVVVFAASYLQQRIRRQDLFRLGVLLAALAGLFFCRTSDYFTALGLLAGFNLAVPFEEKFVRFEGTRQPVHVLLRMAGGLAGYLVLNTLLKLPFSPEFLDQPTLPALLVRTLRYTIVVFVLLGVYPMLFRKTEGKKEADRA